MRKRLAAAATALGFALLAGGTAFADGDVAAAPLTLDAAISLALERNPDARMARTDVLAASAALRQANAPRLPSASASDALAYANPVAQLSTPFGTLPFSTTTTTNVPLIVLNYRVFDGGLTAARASAAAAGVAEAVGRERMARAALIDVAATTYFDLVAAIGSAAVGDRAFEVAQSRERDTEKLFAAGQIPRSDVLSAQADVAGRRLAHLSAIHAVAVAQVALDAAIGMPLDVQHRPADPLDAPIPEFRVDALLAAAHQARGDLAAARAAVDAATFALDEARAGHAPRVDLNVADGNVQPAVAPGYRNQFSVGLNAVWTLFDNGATAGRVDAARAGLERARLALEGRERDAAVEVRDAYLALLDARAQVEAARAYVTSASESLRLAQVRYRGGVGTLLEVADAEVRAAAADQALVAAEVAVRKGIVHARFRAGLL